MTNYRDKHFKLFANCIPVKGASQSIICDLQRKHYEFIPNTLFEILKLTETENIEAIKRMFDEEEQAILDEYFDFLLEDEWGFLCSTKEEHELFPDMNMAWDHPSPITHAILDVDASSTYDLVGVIQQLEELNCKHIQIRSYSFRDASFYDNLLSNFKESCVRSFELITPSKEGYPFVEWERLVNKVPRIHNLTLHSSSEGSFIHKTDPSGMGNIMVLEQEITSEIHCGLISPTSFIFGLNISAFTEAKNHNSCLNKKLSVDVNGELCNCPSLPERYGNVRTKKLSEVVKHSDLSAYWHITKDQVQVCKDCEFRYICTDCRAYTTEGKHSKPLKCNYNPYKGTWGK